jgi:putative endonuclease
LRGALATKQSRGCRTWRFAGCAHTVSYNPVGVRQSAVRNFHAPRALRLHHGSDRNGALYTGVTSNLSSASTNTARASGRVSRAAIGASCWLFYETRKRMDEAIASEKQLEGGSRAKKMALIEAMNQWRDLYADFA